MLTMRRVWIAIVLVTALAAAAVVFSNRRLKKPVGAPSPVAGAMVQDAYVWQRDWSPGVRDAVVEQAPRFHRLVLLTAEISWPTADGRVVEVKPDYAAAVRDVAVGIAVRVGPVTPGESQQVLVVSTAMKAVAAARAAGANVAELQLDYDCAESKLPGYVRWVTAVKSAVAPVPVVVTALPAWLNRPAFADLARASDGFVIQVHSLHKPTVPDEPMSICDPAEARRAVASASKFGVPFRVALPTYGYTVAFKPDRTFFALAAEGPSPDWRAGTIVREMRADPAEMAALVAEWIANPPANCTGIIWYRLPVPGDRMNWSPVTLKAVMAGRAPAADVRIEVVRTDANLRDLFLVNAGDADAVFDGSVAAEWDGGGEATTEGIGGFTALENPPGGATFKQLATADGVRLPPGGRSQVGWIRLDTDMEVRAHVVKSK
jgi:hypothetical protein